MTQQAGIEPAIAPSFVAATPSSSPYSSKTARSRSESGWNSLTINALKAYAGNEMCCAQPTHGTLSGLRRRKPWGERGRARQTLHLCLGSAETQRREEGAEGNLEEEKEGEEDRGLHAPNPPSGCGLRGQDKGAAAKQARKQGASPLRWRRRAVRREPPHRPRWHPRIRAPAEWQGT